MPSHSYRLEGLEPRVLMSAGPFIFADDDGDIFTVKLAGAGSMAVVREGADSDGTGPIATIDLKGTDDLTSVLTVSVKKGLVGDGIVNIGTITSDGGLLKLTAPSSDLSGGLDLIGGLVAMKVRDITSAASINTGPDPLVLTTVQARTIGDGSAIDFGTILQKFTAAQVLDATITAPSAVSVKVTGNRTDIAGDFKGELDLTDDAALWSLGSLWVAHSLNGATINAVNSIKSVSTGTMIDTNIFAGMNSGQSNMPATADDFANRFTGLVSSVLVRGNAVDLTWIDNSNVAAWSVGTVKGGFAVTDNGGTAFGVSANTILQFIYTNGIGTTTLIHPEATGATFSDGDYTIRLF